MIETDSIDLQGLKRRARAFTGPGNRRDSPGHRWPLYFALAIILLWAVAAILAPWITPYDPFADDILSQMAPPDAAHWFGADQLGRDVFSRVLYGARSILLVAPTATLIGVTAGTALGLVLGYMGGFLDAILGRVLDAIMSLPLLVLALLTLVAVGPSDLAVTLVVGFVYTPIVARTIRAVTRSQKELDYVSAARLSGRSRLSIMFFEILPNIRQIVLIESIVRLGYAFFSVATLSFLGLGIQPPSPDWGVAIAESYGFLTGGFWWVVVFNAAAIISLVVSTNIVAEQLGAFDE